MIREAESLDKNNMEKIITDFSKQCQDARKLCGRIKTATKPSSIVIGAMGGSAIAGDFLRCYLPNIPISVVRDYQLPETIQKPALIFIVSYSGNTEESLSMFQDAYRRGHAIICMSSGGKLESVARAKDVPYIRLPSGVPPRLSTGYIFFPILGVLQNSGIIPNKDAEVEATIRALENPKHRRMGEELANRLKDRIPLVYSSGKFGAVAMKWKTDINENAKTPAFFNIYPEFNHNELNGFLNLPGRFHAIILRDENEHPRIAKRMDVTKKIIRETGTTLTELGIKGDNELAKLFSTMLIGLWASYFLAILYGTDPTPVPVIEMLKKDLK